MLTPRFALDDEARFAVSRTPFVVARDPAEEHFTLRFFTAVLNSSVAARYVRTYAPKYGKGYNRLEANLLKSMPVPDLGSVDPAQLRMAADIVDSLQDGEDAGGRERELDSLIAELYGFSSADRRILLGSSD